MWINKWGLANANFFADVWTNARERHNERVESFNDFKPGARNVARIG